MNGEYDLLRERRSHGTAMFPFMIYEIETDERTGERVGCHWHEEFEFLAITGGTAEVTLDGRSYTAGEGNIFIIPPDCLHAVNGEPGVPFSFFAVDFSTALLNSFMDDRIQQKYIDSVRNGGAIFPPRLIQKQDGECETARILAQIREIFTKKEPAYELLVKARLYEIWYLLYTHAGQAEYGADGSRSDYQVGTVRSVIEYLKAHYEGAVSLEELSKEFGISRGHLCRLFKQITKMTIVEYLNYYRITRSVRYLRETDREISEIAGMTGFGNISYFNRVFRSYMHMTPTEYRNGAFLVDGAPVL